MSQASHSALLGFKTATASFLGESPVGFTASASVRTSNLAKRPVRNWLPLKRRPHRPPATSAALPHFLPTTSSARPRLSPMLSPSAEALRTRVAGRSSTPSMRPRPVSPAVRPRLRNRPRPVERLAPGFGCEDKNERAMRRVATARSFLTRRIAGAAQFLRTPTVACANSAQK